MALEVIPSDARILAAEDEWLKLGEDSKAEPSSPLLGELVTAPENNLLEASDRFVRGATRFSCLRCGAETCHRGGTPLRCQVCGESSAAFLPTALVEDCGIQLGHRSRPFTMFDQYDPPPAA